MSLSVAILRKSLCTRVNNETELRDFSVQAFFSRLPLSSEIRSHLFLHLRKKEHERNLSEEQLKRAREQLIYCC